jgi:DNA mismatch repair protein MutL
VHPTKQEIKFEDEKIVYAFVQAAIKHALAQFSITPTLDFDLDASIQQLPAIQQPFTEQKQSAAAASDIFRDFTRQHQAHSISSRITTERPWKSLLDELPREPMIEKSAPQQGTPAETEFSKALNPASYLYDAPHTQLNNTYILVPSPAGFLLIHQQAAHERILYERLSLALNGKPVATHRCLFPVNFDMAPADAAILEDVLPELKVLGYLIEPFGKNSYVIQGTPADITQGYEQQTVEMLLEQYKHFSNEVKFTKREKLVRSAAWQQSIKAGKRLSEKEMRMLTTELFACEISNVTPNGNPVFLEFKQDQLEKMFGR